MCTGLLEFCNCPLLQCGCVCTLHPKQEWEGVFDLVAMSKIRFLRFSLTSSFIYSRYKAAIIKQNKYYLYHTEESYMNYFSLFFLSLFTILENDFYILRTPVFSVHINVLYMSRIRENRYYYNIFLKTKLCIINGAIITATNEHKTQWQL
jgi:hypothetical protein